MCTVFFSSGFADILFMQGSGLSLLDCFEDSQIRFSWLSVFMHFSIYTSAERIMGLSVYLSVVRMFLFSDCTELYQIWLSDSLRPGIHSFTRFPKYCFPPGYKYDWLHSFKIHEFDFFFLLFPA